VCLQPAHGGCCLETKASAARTTRRHDALPGRVVAGNHRSLETAIWLESAAIKSPNGFPTDTTVGAGQTIAVVSAYNSPHAEGDLSVFLVRSRAPNSTAEHAQITLGVRELYRTTTAIDLAGADRRVGREAVGRT